MGWRTGLITLFLAYCVHAFSKYGRTCRDIGCLNSEVCVLAEDPCSYGQTSNCGTYPTCKKKSQVQGSHSNPAPASRPRPKPTEDLDIPPNYPAPTPRSRGGFSFGGGYPNRGNTNTGSNGSPNAYNPYGTYNTRYGGYSPYGGTASNSGYQPYGTYSGVYPSYGGNSSPYGTNNRGSGISSIFGNFSRGGLTSFFNNRPIQQSPNYSTYNSDSRNYNQHSYPQSSQSRLSGQANYSYRNAATTRKPGYYGWNIR